MGMGTDRWVVDGRAAFPGLPLARTPQPRKQPQAGLLARAGQAVAATC